MEMKNARMIIGSDYFEFSQDAIDLIFDSAPSDPEGLFLQVLSKKNVSDRLWFKPCEREAYGARHVADPERTPLKVECHANVIGDLIPWLANRMLDGGCEGSVMRVENEDLPGVTAWMVIHPEKTTEGG